MSDAQPLDATQSQVETRRGIRRLAFVAVWLIDILILNLVGTFPRHTAAYQWLNRFAIFVGLLWLLGFAAWALPKTGSRWNSSRSTAWIVRIAAIGVPLVFVTKGWDRILDAFWLR